MRVRRLRSALIHLYPPDWRRRYGAEMEDLLERDPPTLRGVADLVAGAIDARMHPHVLPAAPGRNTGVTMVKMMRCGGAGTTPPDQWRSAGWMVGGSLVLTLFGLGLRMQIGPNALSEALLYAAFPAALMLSTECTYLKPYSRVARRVMSIGGAVAIVLTVWAAVAVASLI